MPNPYTKGIPIINLVFKVIGIIEPKNKAAEIGQKDNAKIIPSKNAPPRPDSNSFCCF